MSVRIVNNACGWVGVLCGWAVVVVGMPGCEARNDDVPTPAFVPGWEQAREVLESTLSRWRDAPASAPLPASFDVPSVQFVDKTRRPDQRLLSFQILGQTEIEYARQFTVRLNLAGEESPQLVKYNVLGGGPFWVFRLEDFEMFTHWQHDMGDQPAANSGQ